MLGLLSAYPESRWMQYAFGSSQAAFALGLEHYDDEDYELSLRYFEIACDRDDDLACLRAAAQYQAGLGTRSDSKQVDRLLRLACDEPSACAHLGEASRDATSAELAQKRACSLGHGDYCARYRTAILLGACNQRDMFACRDLARGYEGNIMARFYYAKACDLGDKESCARAQK
jgi:TPR repeat protein